MKNNKCKCGNELRLKKTKSTLQKSINSGKKFFYTHFHVCSSCGRNYLDDEFRVDIKPSKKKNKSKSSNKKTKQPQQSKSFKKYTLEELRLRDKKWKDFNIDLVPVIERKYATYLDEKGKYLCIYLEEEIINYYPMSDKVKRETTDRTRYEWLEDGYEYLMNNLRL